MILNPYIVPPAKIGPTPKVIEGVPSKGWVGMLAEAIQVILAQAFGDYGPILCSDGKKHNSQEVMRPFKD